MYNEMGQVIERVFTNKLGVEDRRVSIIYDEFGRVVKQTARKPGRQSVDEIELFYDGREEGGQSQPGQVEFLTKVKGRHFSRRARYREDGKVLWECLVLNDWRSVITDHEYFEDGTARVTRIQLLNADGKQLESHVLERRLDRWGREEMILVDGHAAGRLSYREEDGLLGQIELAGSRSLSFGYDQLSRSGNFIGFETEKGVQETSWAIGDFGDII